jgi:hypothetical protein
MPPVTEEENQSVNQLLICPNTGQLETLQLFIGMMLLIQATQLYVVWVLVIIFHLQAIETSVNRLEHQVRAHNGLLSHR